MSRYYNDLVEIYLDNNKGSDGKNRNYFIVQTFVFISFDPSLNWLKNLAFNTDELSYRVQFTVIDVR